jgi:hypothetical protein
MRCAKMKRYNIRPDAIVSSYTGEWIRDDIEEYSEGEWVRYEDVKPLLERLEQLEQSKPKNNTHPYIWGDGWYAIPDPDDGDSWCLAPKEYFLKYGFCADGWEWEIPDGMDADDLDDFIDIYGCEPQIPHPFRYCCESTICCDKDLSFEEQKELLRDFGFIVDDVPKWKWERK